MWGKVTIPVEDYIKLYTKANIADEASFSLLEQEWKKILFYCNIWKRS